ncbi:MAG TPA: sigma-70 family RNA polymerase sigma factor [Anaerolineae bacterium]|nr:sigma-70 family RNA polymerase sigma factor [Anaerolineae bacterium]
MVESASARQVSGSTPSEAELIEKAISGDSNAFANLYDTYVDEIYRFILHRVGNQQTAEDLTSQVFLKAWDNLSRYKMRGSPFGAWLFKIARNIVIDYYRTQKETLPLEAEALSKPDPTANVAKEVEQRLQGEWLREILLRLTEDQREVLTLKFVNGLKTAEVAKVMGKRQGAIRALQMRALQALAELVGGDHEQ